MVVRVGGRLWFSVALWFWGIGVSLSRGRGVGGSSINWISVWVCGEQDCGVVCRGVEVYECNEFDWDSVGIRTLMNAAHVFPFNS